MFSAGQIEKVNTVLEVDEDTGELGIGSRFYICKKIILKLRNS